MTDAGSVAASGGVGPGGRSAFSGLLLTPLRTSRGGLFLTALAVGVGAGAGAVVFRYLIFLFTFLVTGHPNYGQAGRVSSPHLPGLGFWFILLAPAVGGLIYGPLIHFFARESRGHGVPEVMVAVAESGGRIRPQVAAIKALASALCIGTGGSVGREGPIVQIGSSLASTFGQWIRMPESRLRLLVACGAAGGISATFNAPLAGAFFGLELILREVSAETVVALVLSSMAADAVGQLAFGTHPFFHLPQLTIGGGWALPLCACLGLLAGLAGVGFQKTLYLLEDGWNHFWGGRPEWARPAVGGLLLGAVLLALPQLYGVGYPVLQHAITSGYVLWFLVALGAGKILACSITIAMGGSGGIFAPSLFIGTMLGISFGLIAHMWFGAGIGAAGAFGMVGMGAVFAGAARAPLTAIAATLEMTGDTRLVLPAMLAVGVATAVSLRLTHGTIYTTKLLRRGTDIDRTRPSTLMQQLRVDEVMRRLPGIQATAPTAASGAAETAPQTGVGSPPQAVFSQETLEQAVRQLAIYGHTGLPVISPDGERVEGWLNNRDVMAAFAARLGRTVSDSGAAARSAAWAADNPHSEATEVRNPLVGYRLVDLQLPRHWSGLTVSEIAWPPSTLVVTVRRGRQLLTPTGATELRQADLLTFLVPASSIDHLRSAKPKRRHPAGPP
ncbi:MAG: chloride channel protein [Candidatus Dormibacteria bacterium]